MLGERVLQVWRWYLHRFRRYRKKTRGGLEIAPPPPVGRGLRTCPALNCQSFFAKLRHLHLCSMCSKYFYYAAEEASSMVVSLRYVDILHPTGHYTVYAYENLCSGLGPFPWENPVHHCLRSVGPIWWLASWPVATQGQKLRTRCMSFIVGFTKIGSVQLQIRESFPIFKKAV